MSLEDFNIHEWEKEKMDELVRYNYYKDGKLEGKELGIKEGRKEGIEETLVSTIKGMLDNNIDIDTISKITKKSVEEIKKIEESMKIE